MSMKNALLMVALALFFSVFCLALPLSPAYAQAPPAATVNVSCVPNPVTVGASTICTANVTGVGTPTGTVTFSSGSGNFVPANGECTLSAGTCGVTFTPTTAAGSPQTITGSYSGDPGPNPNNGPATGTTPLIVVLSASTTFISCVPSSVPVGSSSTCTASVTGYSPAGNVQFSQVSGAATTSITTPVYCTLSQGTCIVIVSTSLAGSANIVGAYSGDSNNYPSQSTTTLTVSTAPSSVSVTCSPASLVVGQATSCQAMVTGYSPTGIIQWQSTDKNGVFSSNPCTLVLGTCTVMYTPTASATITATYPGDQNNQESVGTFSITANVNEEIQVVVADSAPSATLTLSGCSVSPTSVVANGTAQTFQAASGCSPITVDLPPPGANARYVTSSGTSSLSIGACAASSCETYSATIYYQVQNTFAATPESPAAWSIAGSVQVNGTALGASGQNICTIAISTGASKFSCQGWSDYGTQVVMGQLKVSATERWATGQNTYTETTGGSQLISDYFSQVLESFEYALVGSATAPSAPALSYTSFGAAAALPLIGSASSVWLDSGSTWTVPAAITGSTASERWESTVTSGAATAGQSVSLTYYHQYYVDFASGVKGGGNAYSLPTVAYTAFGVGSKGPISQVWVDSGSAFNYTDPLSGSTSVERWFSPVYAGTVSAAGTVNETYYHQFAFDLNFTVSGAGTYSNPRLTYFSLSVPGLEQVNATKTTFWVDAGSNWSITPLLPSSSATEQWVTKQTAGGTANAPLNEEFLYYHQFLATMHYTILDGGTPAAPSLNFTSLAVSKASPLNSTATSLWMDSGSAWAVPLVLTGGHAERWLSNVTGAITVTAPFQMDVLYTHQYYVEVGVSTPAGGQVGNTDQWRDNGSQVILNATAAKAWSFEYWLGLTTTSYNGTTKLPTLTVSGPANETAVFYPGLTLYATSQGSLDYSFGSMVGSVPAGANTTVYPTPGGNVTLIAVPNTVSIMFSGWSGVISNNALKTSVAITSPGYIRASFATDYTDIRTFAVATLGVFLAACYVFIIRRGFTPRIVARQT